MSKFISDFNAPVPLRERQEIEQLLKDYFSRGGKVTRIKRANVEMLETGYQWRYGKQTKRRTANWKDWKVKLKVPDSKFIPGGLNVGR